MNLLDSKRLGFALGTGFAAVYLGSIFIIHTVPREEAIWFFNGVLHGVDVTSVLRWEMPASEMVVGIFEVFILGWLFGAAIAILYNLGAKAQGGGHE
jgi:hypothetical protein